MDNDIEELFLKKQKKENINIDNSLFSSFEDYSFRSNTFQSNFNTTKGRINNPIEYGIHYNYDTNKSVKNIIKKDNSKNIIGIKKCELNKSLMNKCSNLLYEKKVSKDKKEVNDKEMFSSTCNSFFKKNVENFINKYLKNNYNINENINTLNNIEKYDNYQIKNITVNKNCSLYNLTKNDIQNTKEGKLNIEENKKYKNKKAINRTKTDEKLKMKKFD